MYGNPTILSKTTAIRAAILRGESDEVIAARLCTTLQAVRVVRKGLGVAQPLAAAERPIFGGRHGVVRHAPNMRVPTISAKCPLMGCFGSIDGTNVSGWGQRRGEPRIVQPLAICRWLSDNSVRFVCWFDANFRWCLRRFNPHHADVLEQVLQREPNLFKLPPAGVKADGEARKADPFVLQDASSVPNGMVISNDLYRAEVAANPQAFSWLTRHPERRLTGQIAANGDLLLGDDGLIRIPVVDDPEYYIR